MAETVARDAEAGNRLLGAILSRDFGGIAASVAPGARFRFLIPPGAREVSGADEVGDRFRMWFGESDSFEVLAAGVDTVGDRASIRYRFRLHDDDGWQEVEQQIYAFVDESGLIERLDLLCSGFRPIPAPARSQNGGASASASGSMHMFDAGSLGCADGLAQEFRSRIRAIPLGDSLVVATVDPAAKEDLPPLARLMGHRVRSVESSEHGRLLITVERGR